MADQSYLSLSGAKEEADAAQARMANAKMRLFKSGFFPTPTTPIAEFEAQEADFDGYVEKTILLWAAPVLAGVGWMTYAPTQTFVYDDGVGHVGNSIGGYWLELATGELIGYTLFDPAEAVQGVGQAIIRTPTLIYRAGL
jgi:hypothetical protein